MASLEDLESEKALPFFEKILSRMDDGILSTIKFPARHASDNDYLFYPLLEKLDEFIDDASICTQNILRLCLFLDSIECLTYIPAFNFPRRILNRLDIKEFRFDQFRHIILGMGENLFTNSFDDLENYDVLKIAGILYRATKSSFGILYPDVNLQFLRRFLEFPNYNLILSMIACIHLKDTNDNVKKRVAEDLIWYIRTVKVFPPCCLTNTIIIDFVENVKLKASVLLSAMIKGLIAIVRNDEEHENHVKNLSMILMGITDSCELLNTHELGQVKKIFSLNFKNLLWYIGYYNGYSQKNKIGILKEIWADKVSKLSLHRESRSIEVFLRKSNILKDLSVETVDILSNCLENDEKKIISSLFQNKELIIEVYRSIQSYGIV